jgi:hypothetical protein
MSETEYGTDESILEGVERLRETLRTRQAKAEVELNESLKATGWVRSTIRFPITHLHTMDDHKWRKVSFVDIGCWRSPTGRVFLTRLDQYNLEQAEWEAKSDLSKTSVAEILGDEDDS